MVKMKTSQIIDKGLMVDKGVKELGRYKNGNYTVIMYNDGTKIRYTEEDEYKPQFAECMDVNITNKCSIGCDFCYINSQKDSKEVDLLSYKFLDTLHPYTEFAINGNDMNHPQLMEFLKKLKEKKVIVNVTVHYLQFMKNTILIENLIKEGYLYGVGISISSKAKLDHFLTILDNFPYRQNVALHMIEGIIDENLYNQLKPYGKKLKLLILGYKEVGRGIEYEASQYKQITQNREWLKNNLKEFIKTFKIISFDNLALENLEVRKTLNVSEAKWKTHYMGDEGEFTFFIDMVKNEYGKNSIESERYKMMDSVDDMFQDIRNKRDK